MSVRYLLRRVLQALLGVVAILLITFVMAQLAPGDAVDALAGEGADPAYLEHLRSQLRLDRPMPEQFLAYAANVLQGDLGRSFAQGGRPVAELIGERLPATLLLMGTALLLSSVAGIVLGTLAARRAFGTFDLGLSTAALIGNALPAFWLAQIALLAVAYPTGLFPLHGMTDARAGHTGLAWVLDVAHHLVLPALVLAVAELALVTRITRTRVLEELGHDYVRTARGKGALERTVLARHALPNALLPVATVIGARIGLLFAGAALTETVFGWPGLGRLLVTAAETRDRPLILGMVLLVAFAVIAANLVTDLVYAWIDPRVRYD
ncbi:MAG: ABC transporter permease [Actinomycetota bacterium]|nr:ABC transporter permease [Actinomycetota bacterium]